MAEKYSGSWQGVYTLILEPGKEPLRCQTSAEIRSIGKHFLSITYTWVYKTTPQNGLIVFANNHDTQITRGVWVDSWHMSQEFMDLDVVYREGVFMLNGTYAAGDGPRWGWRTEINFKTDDSFGFWMFNVTPDKEEALAVEASYSR